MVTGSHNPPQYNGLKMLIAGDTLYGDGIKELYHLIKDDKHTACGLNYWEDDIDADSNIKEVDCKKCLKNR